MWQAWQATGEGGRVGSATVGQGVAGTAKQAWPLRRGRVGRLSNAGPRCGHDRMWRPRTGGTAAATPAIPERNGGCSSVSWVAAMRLAARIHSTRSCPKPLRGDPHSVLACILTGEELGLGPMQSLRMVNVIEGRPAASAELMRALVNRAGHRLSVVEATVDHVTLYGQRQRHGCRGDGDVDDGRRATGPSSPRNPAWGQYPRSMLLARATSELCRQFFSDVIGGLYTPEESAAIEGQVW